MLLSDIMDVDFVYPPFNGHDGGCVFAVVARAVCLKEVLKQLWRRYHTQCAIRGGTTELMADSSLDLIYCSIQDSRLL